MREREGECESEIETEIINTHGSVMAERGEGAVMGQILIWALKITRRFDLGPQN